MIVVVAMVLMLMPILLTLVFERAAKKGRGPLAAPTRAAVIDGLIVSTSTTTPEPMTAEPVFTDPPDAKRCATESRLVRELLAGTLDRGHYRTEMAALAADAASPPVQLPGDPDQ